MKNTYISLIRDIPDFPKPGILFKDITPLLADAKALDQCIKDLAEPFKNEGIEYVVAVEARGFIFGTALARELGAGFVPVRKPNKLPAATHSVSYDLEYGTDTLQIHQDALPKGAKVLVCDDLLATGGTVEAVLALLKKLEAKVVGFSFLIELKFLNGRDRLKEYKIFSLLDF